MGATSSTSSAINPKSLRWFFFPESLALCISAFSLWIAAESLSLRFFLKSKKYLSATVISLNKSICSKRVLSMINASLYD
jgi:hypothetical protein